MTASGGADVTPGGGEPIPPPPESDALQLSGIWYLDFLHLLNAHLAPQSYLEIGTDEGESLSRLTCDAIAVDPEFKFKASPVGHRRRTLLFQMTADAFFRDHDVRAFFPAGVDLAFLDGLHRFEFLLRDFINTEASAHRRSLVLLHDCLPRNERMARRIFEHGPPEEGELCGAWTGDVWKILPILKQYRPDLHIQALDCPPTGLIAISRLDPASTILHQHYYEILDQARRLSLAAYGMTRLWSLFPLLDTVALSQHPHDLTAVLTVY